MGIVEDMGFQWFEMLKYPPELVIINLDDPNLEIFNFIDKLSNKIGIIANYIGTTSSYEKGFEAFKTGFVDVMVLPFCMEKILMVLMRYERIYRPTEVFCIKSYKDFHYLNLKEVVLIKAERYISEFFMKDGTTKSNFKNLMNTHKQLPFNFQRISRSFVVNAHYVYRIHTGKRELHLHHYPQPIRYSKKYSNSIIHIKQQLFNAY